MKGIVKAGNKKAICDVKINIYFKYSFVALWRPFLDYSNYIFSKKQLSNIEPQITSSKKRRKKIFFFFFFPQEWVCQLTPANPYSLKEGLLTWTHHQKEKPGRSSPTKTRCVKSSLWSSKDYFLLQTTFQSLREKMEVHPPCGPGIVKKTSPESVWWQEWEIAVRNFLLFTPLVLFLTHPPLITVHSLRTGCLTEVTSPN